MISLISELKKTNRDTFRMEIIKAYKDLFTNDPQYAYSASRCTPESLAAKMLSASGPFTGNKDGEGIKRACKACGIKHTYMAINEYIKN